MANTIKSFTRKAGGSNVQKVGTRKIKRTVAKRITTKTTKPKTKAKVDPLNRISGMSLYGGESKIEKVGRKKVLITRDKYLDRNGNPVYRASVINSDGTTGKAYRSNGGPGYAVEHAINDN